MFYKSINKKLLLIIIIFTFCFITLTAAFEVGVIPYLVRYNNSIKIERIENTVKEDISELPTYDDLEQYLFEISYSENVYITLYDIDEHQVVWQYLTEENVSRIKTEYANKVSERMFTVVTGYGKYNINILSYTQFTSYIVDVIINLLPFVYVISLFFIILIYLMISKVMSKPIIGIKDKLYDFSENNIKYNKFEDKREDEIGEIDNTIYKLLKSYDEINRTLQGDEKIKEEREQEIRQNVSMISHELKTPLTVIKLQTDCMLANIGDYKDRDKYLKENLKNIEKLETLVESILESTKIDQQKPKIPKIPVYIDQIIAEQISELNILMEQKDLKIDYQMKTVSKNVDEELFRKAIKNILENAIKYSEESELITISLNDDIFEVTNVNNHITNSDLKGVFDPFVRGDKSRNSQTGGNGMGLYIVAKSLEKHNFGYSIEKIRDKVFFKIEF